MPPFAWRNLRREHYIERALKTEHIDYAGQDDPHAIYYSRLNTSDRA